MCSNPLGLGRGCHGRKVYDFVYGAFSRREEDFVFLWDFFVRRVENPMELSEVETRSASLSVLFTDLHGARGEARQQSNSGPCDVPAGRSPAPRGEREGRSE